MWLAASQGSQPSLSKVLEVTSGSPTGTSPGVLMLPARPPPFLFFTFILASSHICLKSRVQNLRVLLQQTLCDCVHPVTLVTLQVMGSGLILVCCCPTWPPEDEGERPGKQQALSYLNDMAVLNVDLDRGSGGMGSDSYQVLPKLRTLR